MIEITKRMALDLLDFWDNCKPNVKSRDAFEKLRELIFKCDDIMWEEIDTQKCQEPTINCNTKPTWLCGMCENCYCEEHMKDHDPENYGVRIPK